MKKTLPPLVVLLLLLISGMALAQPANDDCANPEIVVLPEDGYGSGTVQSTTVSLAGATTQINEFFHPTLISAANDKKSIWFRFSLPTAKGIRVEVKQPGNIIPQADAGFAVYKADECFPGLEELEAAKITPVNKFGSS